MKKILIIIILLGGFLRFYKLDWGGTYFFHPDEYHIGGSASQLSFPDQMHPHFFSYGTFISYLIYFSREAGQAIKLIPSDINPILIGRFYSALFSTMTIYLMFLLSARIAKRLTSSLLAATVVALTPGLIQQAHYATPESLLIFWILLSILSILYWLELNKWKYLVISAISFGAALSIKVSGLIFLPALGVGTILKDKFSLSEFPKKLLYVILFIFVSFLTFFLIYPYSILDWQGFRHSMNYETGVGRGDPLVFYTRQFINTTPIVFQFTKILPYVQDPASLVLGTIGVFYSIYVIVKKKFRNKNLIIISSSFLLFFVPSSFLFAKWTRFIIPVIPFFAIFTAFLIDRISNEKVYKISSVLVISSALLWSTMFFQIYLKPDVRIQANRWLNDNLPAQSYVFTEAGNMIEVPIAGPFRKISFDFYHLDEDPRLEDELIKHLAQADYFIVQSRRIYYNHQGSRNRFPITSKFYDNLFDGDLGFKHIRTFTAYPTIPGTEIQLKDEFAEETWTVFDHPVLRVYEKKQNYPLEYYEEILDVYR